MVDWMPAYKLERKVAELCGRMEQAGWRVDEPLIDTHLASLERLQEEIYDEVRPSLRKVMKTPYAPDKSVVNRPFMKSGAYSSSVTSWYEHPPDIGGPFTRVDWLEPNLGSDMQLKELLFDLGWKPTTWNYKKDSATGRFLYEGGNKVRASPKLTEDSYASLTSDVGKRIAEYLKASHRHSFFKGVRSCVVDGFVYTSMNTLGTNTARMTHAKPVVNVPKAKDYVFYGKQSREIFIARPGRVLVGWDASGLEARVMGHYMNDPHLTHELIAGDFHTLIWNIVTEEFCSSRDNEKSILYCLMYGGQDAKLGQTADTRPKGWSDVKAGKEVRRRIMAGIPALNELTEKVQRASKKGWVKGIDGRKIFIRSEHSALNALFQSTGSILVKTAVCYLDHWATKQKLDVIPLIVYHDEVQADVLPDHAEPYGGLAVKAMRKTGDVFNLNCPLDAEYSIGKSWKETH